jgi:hypothetical protein
MAKRSDFRVLIWIPTAVKEIEHELNDRELVFAWLIYTLHKNRYRSKRNHDDVYHMANNDFQNIMGWTSFMYKWNEALEPLRKIFRIGQRGGYWEIQFKPETMAHAGNPPKKSSPKYDWTYITDPQAIAIHFYIQARMHSTELLSDWHEGQDLNKFYSESVLPKATYEIMKFRKHLYYNDDC